MIWLGSDNMERTMTNKMITRAISAVIAMGLNSTIAATTQATAQNTQEANQQTPMVADLSGTEKCYGVAKAGLNDCATASHGCAGEAKMNGAKDSWIAVPTGVCNKILGGNTKEPHIG